MRLTPDQVALNEAKYAALVLQNELDELKEELRKPKPPPRQYPEETHRTMFAIGSRIIDLISE